MLARPRILQRAAAAPLPRRRDATRTLERMLRTTPPRQVVGPLVAGVGVALVAYATKLLLQASRNPRFQEAMRSTAGDAENATDSARPRQQRGTSASNQSTPKSYFTTDVMGVDMGEGTKQWSGACAAIWEQDAARVVENEQGGRVSPSIVAFKDNGETLVGQPAKNLLFSRTAVAVAGHQLLLGLPFDPEACRELVEEATSQFSVVADDDGMATVQVHGVLHPPAEITGRTLQQLKLDAERALGGRSVLSAAIGVPAAASSSMRTAIVAAGRRAGLNQIELIPSAVAAAVAADEELRQLAGCDSVAVFELHGRSSALTVLRRASDSSHAAVASWELLAARRQLRHGAEAFDAAIVAHLVDDFFKAHSIDLRGDHLALQRLHEAAESAKVELCTSFSADISLHFISADAAGPKHLDLSLSRARFDALTESALRGAFSVCGEALADAGMRPADVDAVLLVGGAARLASVVQHAQDAFGKEPLRAARPEEAVALGATKYARQLQAVEYGA